MSILQALDRYYDRIDGVAEPGYAPVKFGWCIVLDHEGAAIDIEDLRDLLGKKPRPKEYLVPWSDEVAKRTSGIVANLFADKTAYVLGRTAGDDKRTAKEHAAFVELHRERIADTEDVGLIALWRFLESWQSNQLETLPGFTLDMLDANIMFRLSGERNYLHERPAARSLIAAQVDACDDGEAVFCLVGGLRAVPARLHRDIKGVENAQSSGAPLVSCNSSESPAFSSYGKGQGLLSPTSKAVAFRYATALNHLLTRDGPNRLRRPIGDATVVFWADASNAEAAEAADDFFARCIDPDVSDEVEAATIHEHLKLIAKGKPLKSIRPDITEGTQFHVLGLSPNAARLSVRFWLTGDFKDFAKALAQHHEDLRIEPEPLGWGTPPSVGRLLVRTTAAQGDFKNIPHQLAGEMMRAVLLGGRYPISLLSAAIIRLRAGDPTSSDGKSLPIGWHAAVIRAVLNRQRRRQPLVPEEREIPMSLDRKHDNTGYQLGRLFAVYEKAQSEALKGINATIRDRYFGAASATPAGVFPLIVRGGQNHLAKLRKEKPGLAVLIERELEEINGHFTPGPGGIWPRSLRLTDQGEFAIGYYHQRATKLTNEKGDALSAEIADSETEGTDA